MSHINALSDQGANSLMNEFGSMVDGNFVIDESKVPMHEESINISRILNIRPMQLTLTGGDWQYLYSIPKKHIDEVQQIANDVGYPISIIGKIIEIKINFCTVNYRVY